MAGQGPCQPPVSVSPAGSRPLNGLGMMMLQYLEQNLSDFEEKARLGARIRARVSVEVEKGISVTIHFSGREIRIANGVEHGPDLYLKSSYLLLADVLSGRANPFVEILRGRIRLKAFPKRPLQCLRILRFLKIPVELLEGPSRSSGGRMKL